MANYSAVSLFSGCGGSDLGLKKAGFEVLWANEKSESACQLHERLVGPGIIEHCDVHKIDQFPRAEILAGCYPCQGYSQAGRRNPKDAVNFLYREFDRALRQIRPLAFIVENVNGMRFDHNSSLLDNQLIRFRSAGYNVSWQVLDAKDFGVPQSRKRLFIVGIRSKHRRHFVFPEPTHGPSTGLKYKTIKSAIWKYRDKASGTYNTEPFHWYYLSRNRRPEWNDVSPCIVAHWRHLPLHPDSPALKRIHTDKWVFSTSKPARRLGYIEAAAIQGFPNPSKVKGQSPALLSRAIGNAVPPPLFAAVAQKLSDTL